MAKILRAVMHSGRASVEQGWTAALGAAPGSEEFARRHSEVVSLFRQVHAYVLSIEDDEDRERNLRYVPHWYDAVVFRHGWNASNQPARNVIVETSLDQLASLGSTLKRVSVFTDSLSDGEIANLRNSLDRWRELLDDADLPVAIAEEIAVHVEHIDWLLRNIDTYGAKPVVDEAKKLLGTGITALQRRPGAVTKIAAAMGATVFFLTGTSHVVDSMNGVLEGLVHTRVVVEELIDGPKEIEQKKPLELPPGQSPTDSDRESVGP
ncbi:hypothetical protein C5E51_34350 [Nocardia nova]|nr:hypothetical protein C5E51_34350 [Nocardia nova]